MTKSDELLAIEAEHGFVFGDDGSHTSTNAPAVGSVVCTNPRCDRLNQHHPIHADTVLPIHCGGCFTVLHCDHRLTDHVHHEGTLAAPLRITSVRCALCGTVATSTTTVLDPIPADTIPLGVLAGGMDAVLRHRAKD